MNTVLQGVPGGLLLQAVPRGYPGTWTSAKLPKAMGDTASDDSYFVR